jgi:hypothetical protein
VEDFSSTVTFWPVDVVIVKLGGDTVATVPDAPPCAGADRALDAPVPEAAEVTSCAAVAKDDVATTTGSPIAAQITAAAAIRPLLLYARNLRALRRRACLAAGTQADLFNEKDVGDRGTAGAVGSKSFIVTLLLGW